MKFKIAIWVILLIFSQHIFATENFAKISKIEGSAYINGDKANVGDIVKKDQSIEIRNALDFIEIKYASGHIIRLKGASVKVGELTQEKSFLQLIRGTIFSVVKKLDKNEKFEVKTQNASFAVRGTRFFIQEEKEESYLCVCEGSVMATKNNKSLEVKKDQDLFVNNSKPFQTQMASEQMINMGNDVFNSMLK